MTGIIITGHGYFAQGIMSAARLIAGDAEMISEVNFPEGMDINELRENMETAIRDMSTSQILILTDIMGGSPFNTASQLLTEISEKELNIITGTNLAAVLQAIFSRESIPYEQLAAEIIQAGKEGLNDIASILTAASN